MALQFSSTRAAAARGPLKWMACASSSLPVPVSPVRSTVAVACWMMREARSSAVSRRGLRPMMRPKSKALRSAAASFPPAARASRRLRRWAISSRSASTSAGRAK